MMTMTSRLQRSETHTEGRGKQSEKPLFLVDQFKVVIKGMHGGPILPTDEDFAGVETP